MAVVYSLEEAKLRRTVRLKYEEVRAYQAAGDQASAAGLLLELRVWEHDFLGVDTGWEHPPRRMYAPWDTQQEELA